MLSMLKKRVYPSYPDTEVTQVSPRQYPLEAPEQSLQLLREVLDDIKQLQAGQESLLSLVAELKTSVNQMKQWHDLAESRFSSLEDSACETHQTVSQMQASQCSAASSFSSQPVIWDAARTAASPGSASMYSEDAATEPAPPSASEQFRTASSTLVYSETEKVAPQLLAPLRPQEMNFKSEAAQTEAEESGNQEDTFFRASPPVALEYNTEPQTLTSTEEAPLPIITFVWSQGRMSESETVLTGAEESDWPEGIFSTAQLLTSTEVAAQLMTGAAGSQERIDESEAVHTEDEGSDQQENNFSGGSPQAYRLQSQPLMKTLPGTPQRPALAAIHKEAAGRATRSSRRCSTNKRSSSTALTSPTTSARTLSHLASSSLTRVRRPTKRQKTSIVWKYFTERSKFIAHCNLCREDVKTGKIGGCGNVGTAALWSHLNRKHDITKEKMAPSVLPAAVSKIQDTEGPSTTERPNGTASSSTALTSPTTSAETFDHLTSLSPTEVRPPTKH